ncbi:MAG TPA: DUF433 domain-containing protein [Gemmataceae bacterium]|nr:DUF433 domain-containing protein [Gemmataceae bacterium]
MNLPDFLTRHKYGEIRLTGHRIDVMHVVDLFNDGRSPEQIRDEFPTLPLDLVRQTIDFYLANKDDVDAYIARCHEEMDRAYAAYQPGPGVRKVRRITERLRQGDAAHVADPAWASLPITEKLRRMEAEERSKTG